jgi:hypothetical protein
LRIYKENESQLETYIYATMLPEHVTPQYAADNYIDRFLALTYPSLSSQERNNSRKARIQKVFYKLAQLPMHQITARSISAMIRKDNITEDTVKECRLFWQFLIDNNKCLRGKGNPFPANFQHTISIDKQNKNAFTANELSSEVFAKLFHFITKELSPINCGVALLASGFPLNDIVGLTWKDIDFISGYDDYAIIKIRRDHYIAAIHDFRRPAIPDTAKYLKAVFTDLCNKYGEETVLESPVVSVNNSICEAAERKDIVMAATNLLTRSDYSSRASDTSSPCRNSSIPVSVLRKNYVSMLNSYAGLRNDPDTFHYLCGEQYSNTTYINYESHTSPEAQYRFYTILQPISVEHNIRQHPTNRTFKDGSKFRSTPHTNHEIAQVNGSITIPPGAKIIIRCPHGVTGCAKRIN